MMMKRLSLLRFKFWLVLACIAGSWLFSLSTQADWISPGNGTVYTMPMVDELTDDVIWRDVGYYEISGNLTISANDKLDIDPGMVLKFDSAKGLTINGALEACGEPEDMVVFTDLQDQWPWYAWRGIKFNDTCIDSECVLRYCVVEHTGSADGVMIEISNASPTISHCQLMWTSSQAEHGGILIACDSGASFPVIEYSLLRSHLGAAIFCYLEESSNNPLVLENDIVFNTGWNAGSRTIMAGGFLDGNYLECQGRVDTTHGSPVDTIGDGYFTTSSTDLIAPQFWMVDGVRNPRSWQHTGVPSDDEAGRPQFFALGQNYPNPFNSSTTIPYNLPLMSGGRSYVTLRVYNLLGQVVRRLVNEPQEPGEHAVIWDGKDEKRREVSSGIYFCLLKAQNPKGSVFTNVKKMVLVK